MKICILGSWHAEKAAAVLKEAKELGEMLAKSGHVLVSGGGPGISALVVEAYKNAGGQKYIAYLTDYKIREKVGEEIGPEPDEKVETDLDYPKRNIKMVRESDIIVALHGGLGALAEMIHAVKDYGKCVYLIDRGILADWVKSIEELKEKVNIVKEVSDIDFNK